MIVQNTITQRHVRPCVNLEQDRLLHLNVRLYFENFVHILPYPTFSFGFLDHGFLLSPLPAPAQPAPVLGVILATVGVRFTTPRSVD
jgi:hypothetical protein